MGSNAERPFEYPPNSGRWWRATGQNHWGDATRRLSSPQKYVWHEFQRYSHSPGHVTDALLASGWFMVEPCDAPSPQSRRRMLERACQSAFEDVMEAKRGPERVDALDRLWPALEAMDEHDAIEDAKEAEPEEWTMVGRLHQWICVDGKNLQAKFDGLPADLFETTIPEKGGRIRTGEEYEITVRRKP